MPLALFHGARRIADYDAAGSLLQGDGHLMCYLNRAPSEAIDTIFQAINRTTGAAGDEARESAGRRSRRSLDQCRLTVCS
jgi:hypothetical protein